MKNVMKTMIVAGVFALFAFAPVGKTKTITKPVVEPVEEVCVEDDAIWCKVEKNGNKASCFFCDCDKLAAEL